MVDELEFELKEEKILWQIIFYCRKQEKIEMGKGAQMIDEMLPQFSQRERYRIKDLLAADNQELLSTRIQFIK